MIRILIVHELRARFADRSAWLMTFVLPVVVGVLVIAAFSSYDNHDLVTISIANSDSGPVGLALKNGLNADPRVKAIAKLRFVADEASARRDLAQGRSEAAILVPTGLGGTVSAGQRLTFTVLKSGHKPIAGEIAANIASAVTSVTTEARLAAMSVQAAGGGRATSPSRLAKILLVDTPASARPIRSANYFGPSIAMVFLFFTVTFGARTLWLDRRHNTVARLRSIGIQPRHIVAAKGIASFLVGVASMSVLWLTCRFALGTGWGPPLGVFALILCLSAAIIPMGFLVAAYAPTEEALDAGTTAIAFSLVLLGGNFVPPFDLPSALRKLALVTPNGWGMRGFIDLQSGTGLSVVVVPCLVLLSGAAVLGGVAYRLSSRMVQQ